MLTIDAKMKVKAQLREIISVREIKSTKKSFQKRTWGFAALPVLIKDKQTEKKKGTLISNQ